MFMIKELPLTERPRERFVKYGKESVSTIDLLAIILKTGSKQESVIDLSKKLFVEYESLKELEKMSITELSKIKGIGAVKAITLLAALELGKRMVEEVHNSKVKLHSPERIYQFLKIDLESKEQEEFVVLYMNTKGELIKKMTLFKGSLNNAVVHPREIYKYAFKFSAASIVICHNHPSGNPQPSINDIEVTKRIVEVGVVMDVLVIDHIIIGQNKYFSFKEKGLI